MVPQNDESQSRGPETLAGLRAAIFSGLGRIFNVNEHRIPKIIRIAQYRHMFILRAALSTLQKHGISLGIGGGIDKCLSIRRAKIHPIKIRISHFDAETLVNKNLIELKFRLLTYTPKELLLAAALTTEETVHALERVLKSAHEPVRRVFITRALNAVATLSERSPEGSIEAASVATSDCGVLARALADPDAVTSIAESDPLAAAKLRGVEAKENLLRAEGGTLSGDDVSKLLGISRQAVDKRRRAGRLIALTRGRRGYIYPAWQFEGGRTLPGLEEVLKALKRHDPWIQAAFMLHPNIQLDNSTPLAELRSGKLDAVVDAALSYGEHGAA